MINKDIETTTLFDAESNTENGRYIYHAPAPTIGSDNNLWLYFGTGDMLKIETKSNTSNRIYGIKDKDFPNFKTLGLNKHCVRLNLLGLFLFELVHLQCSRIRKLGK